MLNPGAILLKAVLVLAAAALVYQYAVEVSTVEVTVIDDGGMSLRAVQPDDPAYREEIARARSHAIWFYVLAGLLAFAGLVMIRRSYRVFRKMRAAPAR